MKKREIRQLALKTPTELRAILEKFQNDLVKLRMEMSLGKSKNYKQIARTRDDIARIKTILAKGSK